MIVQPIIIDGEPEWEVDRILLHHIVRWITEYLTSFVGFDISELFGCLLMIYLMLWIYCINIRLHTKLGDGFTFW